MSLSMGNQNLWNFFSITGYYFYEAQDFAFHYYLPLSQEGILMNNNFHCAIIISTLSLFIAAPSYYSEIGFSFVSFIKTSDFAEE